MEEKALLLPRTNSSFLSPLANYFTSRNIFWDLRGKANLKRKGLELRQILVMPRTTQLQDFPQGRSDNFTWYLQTHFMLPLLSIGEDCASHTVPVFPTSTRGNGLPSFSLTPCPGKAAATGQHHIPCAMAQHRLSIHPADSRAPWDGACAHSWSQQRDGSCKPPTLGEPPDMGSSRVPVHSLLSTELFLHIKNDHCVCLRSPGCLQYTWSFSVINFRFTLAFKSNLCAMCLKTVNASISILHVRKP